MKTFLLTIALISLNLSFAQYADLGSWNILNLKYNFDEKWSAFGETQLRSLGFYDNFNYYEYKAALNYKVHPSVLLTIGAGSYQTFQDGANFVTPKKNNEIRLWPQIASTQSIGKIIWEQRFRTELRFTSDGYHNRFRYRIGLSYPFGKKVRDFKPFQTAVSDELFFTNREPFFERNRILFTFHLKPTKGSTIQMGYVHQFDYKINDETGRDFFLLGYFIELFPKDFNK